MVFFNELLFIYSIYNNINIIIIYIIKIFFYQILILNKKKDPEL